MASLERTHSVTAFAATTDFHRYEASGDPQAYAAFQRKMSRALDYSSYFGTLPIQAPRLTTTQLEDGLLAHYSEMQPDQAFYMVHLIKAMYWYPLFAKLLDNSRQGGEMGRQMLAMATDIHALEPGPARQLKQRQFVELEQ